ncbi:MAG: thiamine pyrophosphate-binding protein [Alphaproteobacteria bacterium]
MATKTIWEAIVEALQAEGVRRIYGLPGNPLHLVGDLVRHSDIEIVLVRHEHSAVACAYAEARLTGKPAVCFGNPGPGITNMVTGLLEATSGSLPVIALSNGSPASSMGMGAFQELDSVPMMRPVTKWAERIVDASATPWVMQRAFSLAVNGRPGAVFIDVPSDLGLRPAEIPDYRPSLGRHLSRADADAVAVAADRLAKARRPLLLCGAGAVASQAAAALMTLAESTSTPVFTTPGGRGVFPEGHDLSLGQVGLYFTKVGKDYYDDADLVISVGSRLEEFSTGAWRYYPKDAALVQIDIDPGAIAMNWRPDVALIGDAALVLRDLLAATTGQDPEQRAQRQADIIAAKAAFQVKVDTECAQQTRPIRPPQIVAAINRVFGHDTVMVHENGGADLWSYYWPYYKVLDVGDCVPMAEQTAMGMGVIGTIGAKLACPERNVVCVTGDGALQMAMMELATAVEQKCGVTWVVLNNQGLGWPQFLQVLEHQQQVATDFLAAPDLAALATAQGCFALRVEDPADVDAALRQALQANQSGQPALLDFHIAKHDYPDHFVRFHHEVFELGGVKPG